MGNALSQRGRMAMVVGILLVAIATLLIVYRAAKAPQEASDIARQATTNPAQALEPEPSGSSLPPRYALAMARDLQGNIWVGSEDEGVFKYNVTRQTWRQWLNAEGLSSPSGTAIAADRLGRIWVGHLNRGVSVYDGAKWQNYEPAGNIRRAGSLSGPLGTRVFAIKVSPFDGDVWIGTDSGLTRYSEKNETWSYYARAEGLPADQVFAMAFDPSGELYLATQSDGVVIGSAADNFKTWRSVRGPDKPGSNSTGEGLGSSLVNDVLVAKDGTIYAATTAGLSWSKDKGATWQHIRGRDYADKAANRTLGGSPGAAPTSGPAFTIGEDAVMRIAEADDGQLWLGFQHDGFEKVDPKTWTRSQTHNSSNLVNGLVAVGNDAAVAFYGNPPAVPGSSAPQLTPATATRAKMPAGARALGTDELIKLLNQATAQLDASVATPGSALTINDDWNTQGEWWGRYGRHTAVLCAMAMPSYVWGAGLPQMQYAVVQGPNHRPDDGIRSWTTKMYADGQAILEMPPVWLDRRIIEKQTTADVNRRDTQMEDYGGSYPKNLDGPHMYCTVTVPAGTFFLSLYETNSPGHGPNHRDKDYFLSIRAHSGGNLRDVSMFDSQPELARARVNSFYTGVYKRFAVVGPAELTLLVDRNYTRNAQMIGLFLDEVSETPAVYFPYLKMQIASAEASTPPDAEVEAVRKALDAYEAAVLKNPIGGFMDRGRLYALALRWAQQHAGGDVLKTTDPRLAAMAGTCCYHLQYFEQWESLLRTRGLLPSRDLEKSLKWDPPLDNTSGLGNQYVKQYLAAHALELNAPQK